jgi:hypothetical protein
LNCKRESVWVITVLIKFSSLIMFKRCHFTVWRGGGRWWEKGDLNLLICCLYVFFSSGEWDMTRGCLRVVGVDMWQNGFRWWCLYLGLKVGWVLIYCLRKQSCSPSKRVRCMVTSIASSAVLLWSESDLVCLVRPRN